MTNQEAISVLESIDAKTDYFLINDDARAEALDMAISALQAQDSKTRRICKTCKHYPPKMDKWPCMDCDMREPADRWESQDVPDTNVGDMVSRQRVIDELKRYFHDEYYQRTSIQDCIDCFIEDILIKLPSAQPESTRTFVELVVRYPDPELCAYKEYKGKPYYSIKYIENGETYVGYGTYNPEVLSQYLKEYFISSVQPEIKPIDYQDCANAMLRMWMDEVVTDREYNRIMDKLNAFWRTRNERSLI